jgi:hypothetical protein
MDFIDKNFDVRVTPFASKVLFYSLFGSVYDLQFGLGSDMTRRSATTVSRDEIGWISSAASLIEERTAPDEVIEASTRRTTDAGSRQRLIGFLARPS